MDEVTRAVDEELIAGRYRLGAVVGTGGVARVHRAMDEQWGRPVAVKIFRPSPIVAGRHSLESLDGRHRAEMRVLTGLDHPNLVRLWDAGSRPMPAGDVQAYLVLELVEGHSLAARLASGPLARPEAARVGAAVAAALAHIHAVGIVHRDVKPANILLGDDGAVVKLADFGVALGPDVTRQTAEGLTVGTAQYLSPEQVRGGTITPAADIYALGLTLREALTGAPTYCGNSVEVALARLSSPPTFPGWWGTPWVELLRAMTATDAADRPSAAEVEARLLVLAGMAPADEVWLDAVLTDSRAAVSRAEAPTEATALRRRGRRGPALLLAAAVATAGVGLAALTAWGDGSAPGGANAAAATATPASSPSAASRAAGPPSSAMTRPSAHAAPVHTAVAPVRAVVPAAPLHRSTHTKHHDAHRVAAPKRPAAPKKKAGAKQHHGPHRH